MGQILKKGVPKQTKYLTPGVNAREGRCGAAGLSPLKGYW